MSFIKKVLGFFTKAKQSEEKAIKDAPPKGAGVGDMAGSLFDLYGLSPLGDALRLENDILTRFADYESMDEYPELHCVVGSTMVPTPDGPRSIQALAESHVEGCPQLVLSAWHRGKSVLPQVSQGWFAQLTKRDAPCVKVTASNGRSVTCTPNHAFMVADGSFIRADELVEGADLVAIDSAWGEDFKSYWDAQSDFATCGGRKTSDVNQECLENAAKVAGFTSALAVKTGPRATSKKIVQVVSIKKAGRHDVYDIAVPGNRCFVANGLLVHNSALDIYADDSTVPDTVSGKTVWIEAEDESIKENLSDLFDKTLNVDGNIWAIARTLCKYGNDYEELFITEDGVVGMQGLPPATVRRLDNRTGSLLGYVQDVNGKVFTGSRGMTQENLRDILQGKAESPEGVAIFREFELVHFRLRSSDRFTSYSVGVLEAARWVWRRLIMLEDALMIYKLTRSPARYVYNVDVGQLPPKQALAYVERVKQGHRKRKLVNPQTGQLDMRINPLSFDEDIWIPVREGRPSTTVDLLEGSPYQGTDEVEYFLRKLYAAIKIPKSYLNFEEAAPSRSILSNEDIRFSRTVLRIQREIRNGLRKIAKIHLIAQDINPADNPFEVFMTVPSAIYELAQLEIRGARVDLASRMGEFVSRKWLMTKLLGFTEQEAELIEKERGEEAEAAAAAFGGGGGFEASADPATQPPLISAAKPKAAKPSVSAHDKVMLDKLDQLLKEQPELKSRIDKLRNLCMDLRGAMFSKNGRGQIQMALRSSRNG